jgi:hypothetical protein
MRVWKIERRVKDGEEPQYLVLGDEKVMTSEEFNDADNCSWLDQGIEPTDLNGCVIE